MSGQQSLIPYNKDDDVQPNASPAQHYAPSTPTTKGQPSDAATYANAAAQTFNNHPRTSGATVVAAIVGSVVGTAMMWAAADVAKSYFSDSYDHKYKMAQMQDGKDKGKKEESGRRQPQEK